MHASELLFNIDSEVDEDDDNGDDGHNDDDVDDDDDDDVEWKEARLG